MAAKVTMVLTDRINDPGAGNAQTLPSVFVQSRREFTPIDIGV
jgi:hypothetical protein